MTPAQRRAELARLVDAGPLADYHPTSGLTYDDRHRDWCARVMGLAALVLTEELPVTVALHDCANGVGRHRWERLGLSQRRCAHCGRIENIS